MTDDLLRNRFLLLDRRFFEPIEIDKLISEEEFYQAAEKRPSAAFPSSFVIEAYLQVRLNDEG